MGKCVPVLVVLPCETLCVIFTSSNRALLRPLVLVGEHVRLQVLEHSTAFWKWAHSLLPGLVIELVAAGTLAAGTRVL